MKAARVPVLEVGGTHVSAAVVDTCAWTIAAEPERAPLDSHADASDILAAIAATGIALHVPAGLAWSVAMPDPFDYAAGIGRFHGVGKFESLDGVDVRAALDDALPDPSRIVFLNDADAFALGEATHGAGTGHARCVGLTLGTGVGSGWVVDGRVVATGPGVPPGGRIHRTQVHGLPLEDTMSRRAIRAAYAAATGDGEADVREIADRARRGDGPAGDVLGYALRSLGEVLSPRLREFGADVVIVGGSMAGSWELFEPWLRDGLGGVGPPITVSADAERTSLLGAAEAAMLE